MRALAVRRVKPLIKKAADAVDVLKIRGKPGAELSDQPVQIRIKDAGIGAEEGGGNRTSRC